MEFIFSICVVILLVIMVTRAYEDLRQQKLTQELATAREEAAQNPVTYKLILPATGITSLLQDCGDTELVILPEYEALYAQNQDMVGWLKIDGTVIDYPVMQTLEDEEYYLKYDFNKEENHNGCLIMDTDSRAGVGSTGYQYSNGMAPSTNLIIHGHTMRSGMMFGGLKQYEDESYGSEHSTIYFDTLYEKREYELIAVFYSQVYMNTDEVFKYYQFFQADTQEEFDDWYDNIKSMSLYDTGVTAKWGDEFITLSCCSYQVEDGRFVVVGKRIFP